MTAEMLILTGVGTVMAAAFMLAGFMLGCVYMNKWHIERAKGGLKEPLPESDFLPFTCPDCEGHSFFTSQGTMERAITCLNPACTWRGPYDEHVHADRLVA